MTVLATWLVWILLIMGFLMVIEYMKDSLNRQVELGNLSDESIQSMLMERQAARIRRRKRAQQERRNRLLHKTQRRSGKDDRKTSVVRETAANVTGASQDDGDGIAMLVRKMNAAETAGTTSGASPETTDTTENIDNNAGRSNA